MNLTTEERVMDKYQLLGTHISLARARNELALTMDKFRVLGIRGVEYDTVRDALAKVRKAERIINRRIHEAAA